MIDIHCHLLPGIDDGPETLDRALRLARLAVANGIKKAVVTPHILPNRYENTLAGIGEAAVRFRSDLAANGIPLELGFAAEVRIGPEIVSMVAAGALPAVGTFEGYRIVLIEFPDSHILPGSDKLMGWLLNHKFRPLIAHPERNKEIMRDLNAIAPFVEVGCLLQVTAGSVAGVFGPRCALRARELLERGWATVLATDTHDMPARMPDLARGRAAAADIVGEEESWRLVRERPAALSTGNPA